MSQSKSQERVRIRFGYEFTQASLSAMSQYLSPMKAFTDFGRTALALVVFVLAGSVVAPAEGGVVLATYALLIGPLFIMGVVSSLVSPLLRTAGYAVLRTNNYVVRPIYDFLILMTIGLPWSISWFWEGKVLGIAIMFIGKMNLAYIGWAVAFLLFTFFVAGVLYSMAGRYTRTAVGEYRFFVSLISGGSLALSIYAGTVLAYIVFAILSLLAGFNYGALIYNIGLIGGFLLTIASLDVFKDLAPSTRYVPLTWNIISMIIGASALAGTMFYVYAMVALTVYLLILYVVSQDGSWLWYALIAVPASPLVAYYLGYITKLVIDGYDFVIAYALSYISGIVFIFVVFIVLLYLGYVIVKLGLNTHSVVGVVVSLLVAFTVFYLGLVFLSAIVGLVSFTQFIGEVYQYLIAPA